MDITRIKNRKAYVLAGIGIIAIALIVGIALYLRGVSATKDARADYTRAAAEYAEVKTSLEEQIKAVDFQPVQCSNDGGNPESCFRALELRGAIEGELAKPIDARKAETLGAKEARAAATAISERVSVLRGWGSELETKMAELDEAFAKKVTRYVTGKGEDGTSVLKRCEKVLGEARALAGEATGKVADGGIITSMNQKAAGLEEECARVRDKHGEMRWREVQERVAALGFQIHDLEDAMNKTRAAIGTVALPDQAVQPEQAASSAGSSASSSSVSSSWGSDNSDSGYEAAPAPAPVAPAPAPAAPEPAPADNDGWVDTSTGGNFCAGTDSNGNSWTYECP